jgi:hypothetical protein
MKNKDQKMLEEAYSKILLKEEEEMDQIPSDQEIQQELDADIREWKRYNPNEEYPEHLSKLLNVKMIKSFFEAIKEERDRINNLDRNKAYAPTDRYTLDDVIHSMYSDLYKELNGIRINALGRNLVEHAISYILLHDREERTRGSRELEYKNRDILYKKEPEITRFIEAMTEDSDLPSAVKTILSMIENAGFEQDENNEYGDQLVDSVRATVKQAKNLSENEKKYILSTLPETYDTVYGNY